MKKILNYNNFNETFNNFDFINHDNIEEFVSTICNVMNIKYDYIKVLDEGGNGIAIDLGNSVLKLTYDGSEAYIADKLKTISSDNLIKIYDVCKYDNIYLLHEEKLITKLNPTINTFISYLNKMNPITSNIENVSDDKVYDFFKNKILSFSRENILKLFNMWKEVYNECLKYNIPLTDFHGKNVGIRKENPTKLVYFDISDPYGEYSDKIKNMKMNRINTFDKFNEAKQEPKLEVRLLNEPVEGKDISTYAHMDEVHNMITTFYSNGFPLNGLYLNNKLIGSILLDPDYLPWEYRFDVIIKRGYRKRGYLKYLMNDLIERFKKDEQADQLSAVVINKKLVNILEDKWGFGVDEFEGDPFVWTNKKWLSEIN